MVYVTHDQVEAMTLGDRIVVMHEGRIQQAGSPLELYEHPANRFVASFIGSPTINLLPAEVVEASAQGVRITSGGAAPVAVPVSGDGLAAGVRVEIGIRPEDLAPADGASAPGTIRFEGEATLVEQLGESHLVYLRTGDGAELVCRGSSHTAVRVGERIALQARVERLHLFDAQGVARHRLS
jgi:multiple sugar transport system ATP-binding protein